MFVGVEPPPAWPPVYLIARLMSSGSMRIRDSLKGKPGHQIGPGGQLQVLVYLAITDPQLDIDPLASVEGKLKGYHLAYPLLT